MPESKIKITQKPEELTIDSLQRLARRLKVEEWQNKNRKELLEEINKIAEFDQKKERIEKILDLYPSGFRPIGQIWLDFFEKSKLWTSIITASIALSIAILNYTTTIKRTSAASDSKIENLEITTQIKNLDNVETNLNNLIKFVQHQKTSLNKTEIQLSNLVKEKNELEPLVNTNREVIEAFFRQQNEYNRRNVWIERLIGFGLGILGSIIASIIFNVFRNRKQGKKTDEVSEEKPIEVNQDD